MHHEAVSKCLQRECPYSRIAKDQIRLLVDGPYSDLLLPGCQSGNEWHKSVSNLSLPYGITDITVFSQTVLMICANRVTKVYIVFFLFIYKKLFF